MHVAAGVVVFYAAIFNSCEGIDGAAVPLALAVALLVVAAVQVAAALGLWLGRWPRLVRAAAVLTLLGALAPVALADGEVTLFRILMLIAAGLAWFGAARLTGADAPAPPIDLITEGGEPTCRPTTM